MPQASVPFLGDNLAAVTTAGQTAAAAHPWIRMVNLNLTGTAVGQTAAAAHPRIKMVNLKIEFIVDVKLNNQPISSTIKISAIS